MITRVIFLQPKVSLSNESEVNHDIDISLKSSLVDLESIQKAISGVIMIQTGPCLNYPNHKFRYSIVIRFMDSKSVEVFETHMQVQQIFFRLQELCDEIEYTDIPDLEISLRS